MIRPGQDIPTPTEELERKTAEALQKWTVGLAEGRYSFPQVSLATGVMWDCTSGLVSRDLMETISDVRNYCQREMKMGKKWAKE